MFYLTASFIFFVIRYSIIFYFFRVIPYRAASSVVGQMTGLMFEFWGMWGGGLFKMVQCMKQAVMMTSLIFNRVKNDDISK